MKKIVSISERNGESTLPNGSYSGLWGGYVIVVNHGGKTYELKTEDGVRGFNISVNVNVNDGVGTFTNTMGSFRN